MPSLTIHVLDTARGVPAAGVPFALFRVGQTDPLLRGATGRNGRSERPLLEGPSLPVGVYELAFETAGYFAASGLDLPQPPFLDQIVIRFGVADPAASYHVPLLVSPWSYSTYRGS